MQLTGTVKNITLILLFCRLIDRGFRFPIDHTEGNAAILKAVTKYREQAERFHFFAKTFDKRFFTACPVYSFVFHPRFRLSILDKGEQCRDVQRRHTVKCFRVALFISAVCKERIFNIGFKLFFGEVEIRHDGLLSFKTYYVFI